MRFRLQVSVAAGFAILIVLVLGTAVALFTGGNRRLALETARLAMARAQSDADTALAGTFGHVVRAVAVTAADAAAGIDPDRDLGPMDAQMRDLPQIDSLFLADAATGGFRQVRRLTDDPLTLGGRRVTVPPGAARLWRAVTPDDSGAPVEGLAFVTDTGTLAASLRLPGDFDPRARPWYTQAVRSPTPVISAIYTFASTGQPGLTMSQRVVDGAGRVTAVAGADMSLQGLAALLGSIRADGVGEVFLLDRQGGLIATSEAGGGPLTAAAMQAQRDGGRKAFRLVLPGDGGRYLVSMAETAPAFGVQPTLGVIVPEAHYTAGIVATTWRVLQLTGAVAVLAVLLTLALARLLSISLARVADEARRIGRFDLSGSFRLTSRITEVDDLGAAVANMKNSLSSFAAYVPKDVVRSIVASGGTTAVGGVSREVSLMFSDIEGFTRKTEHLPPEVVTAELSRYFQTMDRAVTRHAGTVDKYIGDCVMALWNAPGEVPDHAAQACRAALACRADERLLTATGPQTMFPTRTRTGLHADRVVVGNVGSAERLQYTAIGGAVNLASRVEGLNKVYGTDILATGAIVERAGAGFLFRPVDLVAPAGTSQPVALHELVGETAAAASHAVAEDLAAEVAEWTAALALYRARDWQGAATAMAALQGRTSRPLLVALYLDRCARHIADPPPADWNGVHVFDRK